MQHHQVPEFRGATGYSVTTDNGLEDPMKPQWSAQIVDPFLRQTSLICPIPPYLESWKATCATASNFHFPFQVSLSSIVSPNCRQVKGQGANGLASVVGLSINNELECARAPCVLQFLHLIWFPRCHVQA